jgi:leader peptidase (prepilin peptidase) / N-methyltransferase
LNAVIVMAGLVNAALADGWFALAWAISAAVLAYLVIWAADQVHRMRNGAPGIGMGDAKLFAGVGAWLGPLYLAPVMLVASLSAVLVLLTRRMAGTASLPTRSIAFGPFIAAAFFGFWCAREYAGWRI